MVCTIRSMSALIELDQPDAEPLGLPADIPFCIWLKTWAPNHPAAIGATIGTALAIVAAFAWLAGLAFAPKPSTTEPTTAPAPVSRVVSVSISEGAAAEKAIIQRDHHGDLLIRAEAADSLIDDRPSSLDNLAAIAITVLAGPNGRASCQLTVDGVVVDTSDSANRPAICFWIAPTGAVG